MKNEGECSALKWLLSLQRPQVSLAVVGMQDDHLPHLVFTCGAYIWQVDNLKQIKDLQED